MHVQKGQQATVGMQEKCLFGRNEMKKDVTAESKSSNRNDKEKKKKNNN